MAKSKYNPETFPNLVKKYVELGLYDYQIAKNLGISQDTFFKYLREKPSFSEAYKKGKENKELILENALFKRAIGYEYEEETTETINDAKNGKTTKHKKTKKHVVADSTSAIFLLTNLNNEKWKRNPDNREMNENVEKIIKSIEDGVVQFNKKPEEIED